MPYALGPELAKHIGENQNIKKIYMAERDQYNRREMDENKVSKTKDDIFIGTYGAEVTEYLSNLRYNIRRSEYMLEKNIQNELIELYIQKQYRLNESDVNYLIAKNDSLIINYNGFDHSDLPALLKRA